MALKNERSTISTTRIQFEESNEKLFGITDEMTKCTEDESRPTQDDENPPLDMIRNRIMHPILVICGLLYYV